MVKTNLSHLTLHATLVSRVCVTGMTENRRQWREHKNHYNDCCFCMVSVTGYNKKNKKGNKYPYLLSAIWPVPHGPDLPVPSPPDNLSDESESSSLQSDTEGMYF